MKYSYQEARRLGRKAYAEAKWRRKDPYLPSFEQRFGNAKRKEVPVGEMEIPTSMIEGTFSNARRESFSRNFLPLLDESTEFGAKWAHLLDVQENEGFQDPIIVYEFNHRFYVAEGNKRTSVMKYQKVPVIPAEVVRILPNRSEMAEAALYEEFLEFFKVAPIYDFDFSNLGDYRTLVRLLGKDFYQKWSVDEVRLLRSEYRLFKEQYLEHVPDGTDISCSDAFLAYLQRYGPAALEFLRVSKMRRQMKRTVRRMKYQKR